MTATLSTEELYPDEINLSSLFAIVWQYRRLIVFGTIGVTLLSALGSFLIPRVYRSEGFYQIGSIKKMTMKNEPIIATRFYKDSSKDYIVLRALIGTPIPFYKSISSQFSNPNRLQLFASQDKSLNEENLMHLKSILRTPDDINKRIKPVYAYAKEDAREFSQLPKDESNSVIGLNLIYEADSPENAHKYVNFLGNYIRDCLLYVTLYNYATNEYSNSLSDMNQTENSIIEIKFQLMQNTNKLKDIRAILTNYPESVKIENRQVVSVQEGGDRFLSPVTQLVGLESALADLKGKLAELEREKEKLIIRSEYFSRSNNELAKINEHGKPLFLLLKSIQAEVFKNKDLSRDPVIEVFNSLNIDLQAFELAFFSNCRFVSGPITPERHIKPQKSLIVIATCLVSFVILVVFAFALHWWQSNKKTIMSAPTTVA